MTGTSAPEIATTPVAACAHCGLAMDAALAEPRFCCAGCRAAHAVIQGCGLAAYYRLRGAGAAVPVASAAPQAGAFDGAAFAAAHVRPRSDGLVQLDWYVAGMHCAACLWLLEQFPRLDAGVRQARVAFAQGRLELVYDPALSTPGRQAELIARLGYSPRPWSGDGGAARAERRALVWRLAVSAASAVGSMHLTLNLFAGELTHDLDAASARAFALLAVAVALPAVTYGAAPLWRGARAALRRRHLTIDVAAAGVLVIGGLASALNLARGGHEVYVDALAMFVALILAGRLAVLTARERIAGATQALDHLLPAAARRADGTMAASVGLVAGETVVVTTGEIVPCDGTVLDAPALVDAAVLTGEARPVRLEPGDAVHAGSTCRSPHLRLAVTASGAATRLGQVLAEVAAAASRPTRLTRLVDRLQNWFIPGVGVLALGVLLGWWLHGDPARGLDQAVALVLVSCPCALGLATPLVQALAVARASARGLLIRDAGVLEVLGGRGGRGGLRHIAFDKTGTLTAGRMQVVEWRWLGAPDAATQALVRGAVAAAEARAQHPLALALGAHLGDVAPASLAAWREEPGRGVVCATAAGELRIGNQALTGCDPFAALPQRGDGSCSALAITLAGQAVAAVACADPLRAEARPLLAALRASGVTVHVLSGDDVRVVAALGRQLGLPAEQVHGGLLPADKAEHIARLATDGATAMVGDGINDAAALARADVGIGLRGGLAAALPACHAFITGDAPLAGLDELFAGARRARAALIAILAVSTAYNLVGIALAAAGIWGPLLCAVAMPASSLSAVLMAAGGGYFRPRDNAIRRHGHTIPIAVRVDVKRGPHG